MVSRLNRNSPLPTAQGGQVDDNKLQRILDTIILPVQAVVEFLQPFVQPEKWKALTYQPDWSDFSTTTQVGQYRKDPMGIVSVRADFKAAGAHAAGDPIAVLPVGYRPPSTQSYFVWTSTGAIGEIEITSAGRINHLSGTVAHISMNISFDTAA